MKDYHTTNNILDLKSLIDKKRQTRVKGKVGQLFFCNVDYNKAFDAVPYAVLSQAGCHWEDLAHHQVLVCTPQRSSAVIPRPF